MPLQDTDPTPSFGGFGLRRGISKDFEPSCQGPVFSQSHSWQLIHREKERSDHPRQGRLTLIEVAMGNWVATAHSLDSFLVKLPGHVLRFHYDSCGLQNPQLWRQAGGAAPPLLGQCAVKKLPAVLCQRRSNSCQNGGFPFTASLSKKVVNPFVRLAIQGVTKGRKKPVPLPLLQVRQELVDVTMPGVKGGVIMDRRGGCERSGVALQNWTTRRLL